MKYYLIAGEASGDLHGSNLMRGLLKSDPAARFRFWGGDRMAEVGGAENRVRDYRETSFFGIVGVLRNLRTISRQLRECREDVLRYAPDVLILVDYPGFNMKMARFAKEHGIRTFYYIAPKVWAWREWRVKAIRRYVDRLYIIFPFERDYFPRHGITPVFEGNPLLDAIAARSATLPSREEFGRANGLDERPVVALVAGSRRGEIEANLPLMCALAPRFPHYQFVVTGVSWLDRGLYDRHLAGTDVRMVVDQTYETLRNAVAAVVTSGTATLETALMRIPEVVVYRTVWWQVWLRPYVLKVPFISLVNLNLGREAVRELVQSSADPTEAQRALGAIRAAPNASGCSATTTNCTPSWAGRVPATASPATWSPNSARERRTATAKHKTERSMKETLIIAIILGAFALLASLRAARLDAANAAKPRRNGRTGGKESAGKGAEQGRLRPTILRTAAVGMAVLAIGITLTTWLLLRAGVTPPTLASVRIGILVAGAAAIITVIERRKRRK